MVGAISTFPLDDWLFIAEGRDHAGNLSEAAVYHGKYEDALGGGKTFWRARGCVDGWMGGCVEGYMNCLLVCLVD